MKYSTCGKIICSACGIEGIHACLGEPVKQEDLPEGLAMAGNWREHILVKCAVCLKLMGYHKESNTAVCNCCERKRDSHD